MNFFHHKDLGNHLLQLCPKVVKHPVYPVQFWLPASTAVELVTARIFGVSLKLPAFGQLFPSVFHYFQMCVVKKKMLGKDALGKKSLWYVES